MSNISGMTMVCDNCGLRFENDIKIGNATQVIMTGGTERCPRCRSWARQATEGTFNVRDGVWQRVTQALLNADATRKDYEDLATLLRTAQTLGMTTDQVEQAAQVKVPRLASVVQAFNTEEADRIRDWGMFLLTLISALFAVLAYWQVTQQPSKEEIQGWIIQAVQDAQTAEPTGGC